MHQITLGKTGLVIEKNGFGCLPIQRISEQDAVYLLHLHCAPVIRICAKFRIRSLNVTYKNGFCG